MFDSPYQLLLGLITGVVFGFLLQKGRVAKFPVIVGQFLFRDWTVVKVMGTAVVVGAIGVYALVGAGLATLHIKPALLAGVTVGATLFGIGISLAIALAPRWQLAAKVIATRWSGSPECWRARWLTVAAFPALQGLVNGLGNLGEVTLPTVTGLSPWTFIGALAFAAFLVAALVPRRANSTKD